MKRAIEQDIDGTTQEFLRNAEAEQMLSRAYEKLVAARGADNAVTKRVAVRLAELMEKLGRADDARKWHARG